VQSFKALIKEIDVVELHAATFIQELFRLFILSTATKKWIR